MDILCLKLKKDLSLKLKEYSQMMDYISCVNYDEQYITDIVENHVSPEVFQFNVKQEYDETKCQARLWAREGKGIQCNHSKCSDSDYCDKHHSMIRFYGTLRFGDIREKRPKYDLIKLKEGKKEKLTWIQQDSLIRLQNLLDKQQKKIINASSSLVVI